MHQTCTGTKKTKKKQNFQQLPRSGPIVPGNFVFFFFFGACRCFLNFHFGFFWFFWCLCRFGDSDFTKHWQAPKKTKKNKPLDAPNLHRHQKKQNFQQLPRSGPIVPGNFVFFGFFWCLSMFPQLSLWFFWFFWCLCRFGDSDFTKHWQAPKKPKKPNH